MKTIQDWVEKNKGFVFMAPGTIFLLLFALYATFYLLYMSVCEWNVLNPTPVFTGLSNYIEVFNDNQFWSSVWKTINFVVFALGIEIILGFIIALALNKHFFGRGLVRTLLIIPMAMTPVVSGVIWRILYDPTLGLINYLLSIVGIHGPAWIARASTAMPALILVDVWQWTPFAFLVITAGLQSLPTEPYEAASIDGASFFQTIFFITIPMLKQVLLVLILIRGIDAIKTFDKIYVLTNGGPGSATQTMVFYTFMQGFNWFKFGYASTIAMFLLIAVIIIVQLFIKYTGVKIFDVN